MEYDFYQKILPVGILKKVGTVVVPDGRPDWCFASKIEFQAVGTKEDILMNPPTMNGRISYKRVKTISGIIYVAEVYPKISK